MKIPRGNYKCEIKYNKERNAYRVLITYDDILEFVLSVA